MVVSRRRIRRRDQPKHGRSVAPRPQVTVPCVENARPMRNRTLPALGAADALHRPRSAAMRAPSARAIVRSALPHCTLWSREAIDQGRAVSSGSQSCPALSLSSALFVVAATAGGGAVAWLRCHAALPHEVAESGARSSRAERAKQKAQELAVQSRRRSRRCSRHCPRPNATARSTTPRHRLAPRRRPRKRQGRQGKGQCRTDGATRRRRCRRSAGARLRRYAAAAPALKSGVCGSDQHALDAAARWRAPRSLRSQRSPSMRRAISTTM